MREWREEIRRRLAELTLEPTREAEIVEEFAQHLEDRYSELPAGGSTEHKASRAMFAELNANPLLAKAATS